MEINLQSWFVDRELSHCPPHFVRTQTIATSENRLWIYEMCVGRYCFVNSSRNDDFIRFLDNKYPAFEDPKEAMLFELTWS